MKMPKLTLLLLGVVMVLAFQNCGNNMSFQQEGSLVAKADVDTNGDGGLNPGDGLPYPSPTPRSPSASPTPRQHYGGGEHDEHDGGHDNDNDYDNGNDHDKNCDNKDRDRGNHAGSSSAATFLCILEGPGNSVKLGLRPNSLAAGTSADQAVCMSENACINIASKAFSVKMADRSGFCKQAGAGGRVFMSDAQMEEAVTKAKVLQMSQEY
jgi:hypothetical protein